MARGSSSRSGCRSSSRRNPHVGFHRVAPKPTSGERECRGVPIDANEAYRVYRRYKAAPRDVKLPGWHLNSNRVLIPSPLTGRERSLAIAEHRRLAGPKFLANPCYVGEGPVWDALFQGEHEAARHSFFAVEPPEWFFCDSVSPPGSADEDASKLYQRLLEEIPPPGWWKDRHDRKGPEGGSSGGYAGASSFAPVIFID